MASDKIEVLSTEYVCPIVDENRHQYPRGSFQPPLCPRTSWLNSEASTSAAASTRARPRIVRRGRIRQPRPYLLRIRIAGLNSFYRSTLIGAKIFWALVIGAAMAALIFMLCRLFYARFILDSNRIRAVLVEKRTLHRMPYPRMKICVKPTISGRLIKRLFQFPCSPGSENTTKPTSISDRWADAYGTYLTAAWSVSDFWWPGLYSEAASLMFGNKAHCARKIFFKNFVDGTAFVRFLYRNAAPSCDKFIVNCHTGESPWNCCDNEKALTEQSSFNEDPSSVFSSYGRCYSVTNQNDSTEQGMENGGYFELNYPLGMREDAVLTFDEAPAMAPIPLPAEYHIIISLKKQYVSTIGNVRIKKFNHTCMEECVADAVHNMCGCRSAATSATGIVNASSTVSICTPDMEIACGIDTRLTATADESLSEIERGFMYHPWLHAGLCGRCAPTSYDSYDETRLQVQITSVPLARGSWSQEPDTDYIKTRVSIFYPEFAIEEIVHEAVGREWFQPWRIRGLMALFGVLSVISIIQAVYYSLLALITRRCSPRPIPSKKPVMTAPLRKLCTRKTVVAAAEVHRSEPKVPRVVISRRMSEEERRPSGDAQQTSATDDADDTVVTSDVDRRDGGLALPKLRRSNVVAWMPHETDPNIVRPSSERRNTVMAMCLNKLVALPYTDDEPIKERTRVDVVLPFTDPNANKNHVDASTSDSSSIDRDRSASTEGRRTSVQAYMRKLARNQPNQPVDARNTSASADAAMPSSDGRTLKASKKNRRRSMPAFAVSSLSSTRSDAGLPDVTAFSNKVTVPNAIPFFRRHSNFLGTPETSAFDEDSNLRRARIAELWRSLIAEGKSDDTDKTAPAVVGHDHDSPSAKPNAKRMFSRPRPFLTQTKQTTMAQGQDAATRADGSKSAMIRKGLRSLPRRREDPNGRCRE